MDRTRLLSQSASFFVIVISFVEAAGVAAALYRSENPSHEAVLSATVPPVVCLLGFGGRFAYLFRKNVGLLGMATSWWLAGFSLVFATGFVEGRCIVNCGTGFSFSFYSLASDFPLFTMGVLWLVGSAIRFPATAFAAFDCKK
jgi:hypothetical protein